MVPAMAEVEAPAPARVAGTAVPTVCRAQDEAAAVVVPARTTVAPAIVTVEEAPVVAEAPAVAPAAPAAAVSGLPMPTVCRAQDDVPAVVVSARTSVVPATVAVEEAPVVAPAAVVTAAATVFPGPAVPPVSSAPDDLAAVVAQPAAVPSPVATAPAPVEAQAAVTYVVPVPEPGAEETSGMAAPVACTAAAALSESPSVATLPASPVVLEPRSTVQAQLEAEHVTLASPVRVPEEISLASPVKVLEVSEQPLADVKEGHDASCDLMNSLTRIAAAEMSRQALAQS